MLRRLGLLPLLFTASLAQADAPRVAVDIAPLHSLVAQVMDGVGTPDLIMPPGASPHHYALRPSEATALAEADLVIWVGPDLTPWLEGALENLAGEAGHIALLDAEETAVLPFREGIDFNLGAEGDHDTHEEHDDHEDHGAHEDHAEEGHDEHDDEHHHHGGIDPHAWLSPENAKAWLGVIAREVALIDPANAAAYVTNAKRGAEKIDAVSLEIADLLASQQATPFLVFHDAYQYFEGAYGLTNVAAISLGDATTPGPARLAALRDLAAERGITCVLTEPQFDPKLARTIVDEGYDTGILDLMGSAVAPGPELYVAMMRGLADGFTTCGQ